MYNYIFQTAKKEDQNSLENSSDENGKIEKRNPQKAKKKRKLFTEQIKLETGGK